MLSFYPKVGTRAMVPFGKKKIYTGIILSVSEYPHQVDKKKFKEIIDVLDEKHIVNSKQIKLINWISKYYMCPIGEVFNAFLPTAMKISSHSKIAYIDNPHQDSTKISEKEMNLISVLKNRELTIYQVAEILEIKKPQRILKKLIDAKIVDVYEHIQNRYQPKWIKKIKLHEKYLSKMPLKNLLNDLEKKEKQQNIILSYLQKVPIFQTPALNEKGYEKNKLFKDDSLLSPSSLKTLIKKNIFVEFNAIQPRFDLSQSIQRNVILTDLQQFVKNQIKKQFEKFQTVLLHGVTGSGKTEIYISLIREQIERNKQVLLLLPEIALTTQIIERFSHYFGNNFGVYHSKFSENERVEVWNNLLNKKINLIIGVRSSIFLPFQQLGLIVVDEEHENTYKQTDRSPRYHARDAAIYLAKIHGATVLLGTATPSVETYFNTKTEKYGKAEILQRYADSTPPTFTWIDVHKERLKKKMVGNFSKTLLEKLQETKNNKKQSILFINRRGYASYVSCENCEKIIKCINCAVSLTYHQFDQKLKCHYCGYQENLPEKCPACQSPQLRKVGFGTQEIEEELNQLIPESRIKRIDYDTMQKKNSFHKVFQQFDGGSIDIIVGTKMISKGLDFDNVNFVGIFDIDRLIYFPEFRSKERAFQMMLQVGGRAGRRSDKGNVYVQTNNPEQTIFRWVDEGNYEAFYQTEITERRTFRYPPAVKMIKVILKHKEKEIVFKSSCELFRLLKVVLASQEQLIGPIAPLIFKINKLYHFELILKLSNKNSSHLQTVKQKLINMSARVNEMSIFKSVKISFDVDPY